MIKFSNILIVLLMLTSCMSKTKHPIITFDSPFPKKNKDLTNILGKQLIIKTESDTLTLNITSNKKRNLILNAETGDTVFIGTVSKYLGMYYFNEQVNDSSYKIYAVKLTDNLIYGLTINWIQQLYIEDEIKKGNNKKLVKYINTDTTIIRLHPDKQELRKLLGSFIIDFPPDTILNFYEKSSIFMDTNNTLTKIDPEDYEYLLKAYPNPTSGILNIELQQKNKLVYKLINLQGMSVLQGQFNDLINRIDLSKQSNGIYTLTLINLANKQKETIKIIKTK